MSLSSTEQTQKEYYNRIAATYDSHYSDASALAYRFRIYDEALKDIPLAGKHVLDAMCGGGQNTQYLVQHDCHISGIDISEAQCEFYKQRFPNNTLICGSVRETGFPDNHFDIVVVDSLHHTHPYLNETITELLRVLKPQGYLLLWEPNKDSLMDIARRLWYKLDKRYFESNEEAISLRTMLKDFPQIRAHRVTYGGNFEYLFVHQSMLLRIPPKLIPLYSKLMHRLEWMSAIFGRSLSCWVLATLQKT